MLFTELQLKSQNFLNEIKVKADKYMTAGRANEAYHLAKDLEASLDKIKDFKNKYFDFFTSYKKLIYRLKWFGLPIMTEEMIAEMFKYHFTQVFHLPDFPFEELWLKLKAVLLAIIVYKDRDEFKKNLRQALLNNQEKLTGKRLLVNNQEKAPTVANWLLDYNSNLGTGVVDNLKRTQYLTTNRNLKILDQKEKDKVKLLLDLYERLKLSSFTLEGLEEDIPVDEDDIKGIIRGGVFEPYKEEERVDWRAKTAVPAAPRSVGQIQHKQVQNRASADLAELKRLAASYPAGSLERRAVEEEMRRAEGGSKK